MCVLVILCAASGKVKVVEGLGDDETAQSRASELNALSPAFILVFVSCCC